MAQLNSNFTITILVPNILKSEIDWLLNWVFERLNNFTFEKKYVDGFEVIFCFQNKSLILPQIFLENAKKNWLCLETLPALPLHEWNINWPELQNSLIDTRLPILYGNEGLNMLDDKNYILNLDVLGSSFFLLTRYEEFVTSGGRDVHDRFLASHSTAFKSGFLERPLSDEYVLVLFAAMQKVWPQMTFYFRKADFQISHDVDAPALYSFKSYSVLIKTSIKALLNGQFSKLRQIILSKLKSNSKIHSLDPFNNFNWIMNQVESINAKSTFYFLAGKHNKQYDGDYELTHPAILNLLSDIHKRGHCIGLHPSYDAAINFNFLSMEQKKLQLSKQKIFINDVHGARMHFLRWLGPKTWNAMARNGITHDASLGFADHIGFRCGTCHPFQAYDVTNNVAINIIVLPLTVMEVTVMDNVYMALGTGDEAFSKIDQIRKACNKVNGIFTLLWHNSRLVEVEEKNLFTRVLKTM